MPSVQFTAQVLSDLHITDDKNRFYKAKHGRSLFDYLKQEDGPEVLILPGDVAPIQYLAEEQKHDSEFWNELYDWLSSYRKVIYVAGNHEYYSCNPFDKNVTMQTIDQQARNILPSNVEYIGDENRSIVIGRYVFICSTLWAEGSSNPLHALDIKSSLNDFVAIPHFTYEDMVQKFQSNVEWIREELEHFDEQSVYNDLESFPICAAVITHHGPSLQSIHPRFRNSTINGAFCSDLDWIIHKYPFIDYWVHGHTHASEDYLIEQTNVICNPTGYTNWQSEFENEDFDPNKTILI